MVLEGRKKSALIACTALARHHKNGPISSSDLSYEQEISASYLEQIFAQLRSANLIVGVRGSGGGYVLARPPAQISVDEILRALEEDSPLQRERDEQTGLAPLEMAQREMLKKFTLDRLIS